MSDSNYTTILTKLAKQKADSMTIMQNIKFDILLLTKGELDEINTKRVRKLTHKLLIMEQRLKKLRIFRRSIKISYYIVTRDENKLRKYTTEELQKNSVLVNHIFFRAPKGCAEYKVLKIMRKRGIVPEHLCIEDSRAALPEFYTELSKPIAESAIVNRMKEMGAIGSLESVTTDVEITNRKPTDNGNMNEKKEGGEDGDDEVEEIGEVESIYVFDM
ncbi:MAG: hypothetical protein MHMPM18_003319 [Marteilia pararefringens]